MADGDAGGAKKYLQRTLVDGKAPKSWNGSNVIVKHSASGTYLLQVMPNAKGKRNVGSVQWAGGGANANDQNTLSFYWDPPDQTVYTASGSHIGSIIPDRAGNVEPKSLIGTAGEIAGSGISSVADLISAISNPALWKRIGIGAVGAALIAVALAIILVKMADNSKLLGKAI